MEWTTDWFVEKGLYLVVEGGNGIVLAEYSGGDYWSLEQNDGLLAGYYGFKSDWIEAIGSNVPIYRSVRPIVLPVV